jgi:hypothetical protein
MSINALYIRQNRYTNALVPRIQMRKKIEKNNLRDGMLNLSKRCQQPAWSLVMAKVFHRVVQP